MAGKVRRKFRREKVFLGMVSLAIATREHNALLFRNAGSRAFTAGRRESVPGKVWVFRDTRLPVATVIENLEDSSVEEVMEQFDVTREKISAALECASLSDRVAMARY